MGGRNIKIALAIKWCLLQLVTCPGLYVGCTASGDECTSGGSVVWGVRCAAVLLSYSVLVTYLTWLHTCRVVENLFPAVLVSITIDHCSWTAYAFRVLAPESPSWPLSCLSCIYERTRHQVTHLTTRHPHFIDDIFHSKARQETN